MQELIIHNFGEFTQMIMIEDENLNWYLPNFIHKENAHVGEIYCARIHTIVKAINSAFIHLDNGIEGFLPLNSIPQDNEILHYPKKITQGQKVLVQVRKEKTSEKIAEFSANIQLKSANGVLTPFKSGINASKSLKDQASEELKFSVKTILEDYPPNLGFVIRSSASHINDEDMAMETSFLAELWTQILSNYQNAKDPIKLYTLGAESSALIYQLSQKPDQIITNNISIANTIKSICLGLGFYFVENITTELPNVNLVNKYHLQDQIDELFSPIVNLPSGGNIVFHQTKALCLVDVNTASSTNNNQGLSFSDIATRTNLEATDALITHIALRQIGGQIIVDYLKAGKGMQKQITTRILKLNKYLKLPLNILGFSKLGLLELTNKRMGSSIDERCLYNPQPRKNLSWQSFDLLQHATTSKQQSLILTKSQYDHTHTNLQTTLNFTKKYNTTLTITHTNENES